MSFRNISAWCIRNPVPPVVMFVLLLLAGLVSFNRMDVNDNPDVEFRWCRSWWRSRVPRRASLKRR